MTQRNPFSGPQPANLQEFENERRKRRSYYIDSMEQPMNLCYTITESPRIKIEGCFKQPSDNKQLTMCHITPESVTIKTETKHSVSPSNEETHSLLTKQTPTVTPTPKCKFDLLDPALTSVAPLSASNLLSANTSNTTHSVSSVCEDSKIYNNATIDSSINVEVIMPKSTNGIISQSASPTVVSSLPTTESDTTKSMSGIVSHGTSQLMHSVESILNKTSKRTHQKPNTSTLSWTPVLETQLSSSGSHCKEKSSKNNKQCSRELISHDVQRQNGSCISNNPECVGGQIGIKRSQSVIEASNSVTEVNELLKSTEVVSYDHINKEAGSVHAENATDAFSSYIPKLQKHLKLCAVKRSASYEGPSSSLTPVMETIVCGDAMEKRNWKKRKLSTLDIDASDVGAAVALDTINVSSMATTSNSVTVDSNLSEKSILISHKLSIAEDRTKSALQSTSLKGSSTNTSLASSGKDNVIPSSVSCMSILSPHVDSTVSSMGKPQIKYSISNAKVKSCSRKTNPVLGTSSTTKNNNRMSCESRYNDSTQFSKTDQVNSTHSRKQQHVSCSDNVPVNVSARKKSAGSIQTKSSRSINNESPSTFSDVSANRRSVEEICVDTSSSPSDVSNVTSPTTYVTSPGTEDRTDSSTLPEIQTSCDTNCVVTFSGKVVPLDLSVKKKK